LEKSRPARLFQLPSTPFARVLVIDDNPDMVSVMRLFLTRGGYEVAAAFDGAPGIASARFFRPHVILLNLMMPGLSGDLVLPLLRRDPLLSGVKIILHSGYSGVDELARAIGADGFLRVPFSREDLGEEVQRVLG
jgi:CheY-like chemotaxis protein